MADEEFAAAGDVAEKTYPIRAGEGTLLYELSETNALQERRASCLNVLDCVVDPLFLLFGLQ